MAPLLDTLRDLVNIESGSGDLEGLAKIASLIRDRLMLQLDKQYPAYGFARHKGYGTEAHLTALRTHGASPIHRQSFAPVRELYGLFEST